MCRTFHHWSSLIYPGWNRYRGQKKDVHSVRIKKKLVKKNNEEELSKSASSAETGCFYRMKEAEFHC